MPSAPPRAHEAQRVAENSVTWALIESLEIAASEDQKIRRSDDVLWCRTQHRRGLAFAVEDVVEDDCTARSKQSALRRLMLAAQRRGGRSHQIFRSCDAERRTWIGVGSWCGHAF